MILSHLLHPNFDKLYMYKRTVSLIKHQFDVIFYFQERSDQNNSLVDFFQKKFVLSSKVHYPKNVISNKIRTRQI